MLTAKQKQAYDFICQYIGENGIAPTDGEIAKGIGIKSRGVAHRYVTALVDAGLITTIKGRRRNIELVKQDDDDGGAGTALPVLGRIAAGQPIEAIGSQETINIVDSFLGPNRFLLQVKGDSMIGDNICDGDYIVCQQSSTADRNDIVVALIEGTEATLKRFQPNSDGSVTLLPSNPALTPLVYRSEQVRIQGLYLGLLRMM